MKKKFKETLIGKILTSKVAKGILKSVPFGIGSLAGNIIDEVNGSKSGEIDKKSIYPQLIKLALYAALAYLIVSGKITPEQADTAKSIIGG